MPIKKPLLQKLSLSPDIEITYIGLPLSEGPLPAVFYLALSAEETLGQDPFNQPALYLANLPMRIFSLTLPGHGAHLPAKLAMSVWAQQMTSGIHWIPSLINQMQEIISTLITQQILLPNQIGIMGLSRGAFVATHIAAHIPQFHSILGFAPLTTLTSIKEFQHLLHNPLLEQLNLSHLASTLYNKQIRFYIGNVDTRVGTGHCYHCIEQIAQYSHAHHIRSPHIELIITPSIGYQGHGTSQAIFQQGAHWLAQQLKVLHAL